MTKHSHSKQSKPESPGLAFWRMMTSLRLTILVITLIALISIIGTLVLQEGGGEDWKIPHLYKPRTIRIFEILGFFHIFHSMVFRVLSLILASCLLFCMMSRLGRMLPPRSGSRHRRHLIFLSVHGGFLLIMIGVFITNRFGDRGFLEIAEKSSESTYVSWQGRQRSELGFEVMCDQFEVEMYPDHNMVKEYRSHLRIRDGGEWRPAAVVRVNHPLRWKGVSLYQSSYGVGEIPKQVEVAVFVRGQETRSILLSFEEDAPVSAEDLELGLEVRLARFEPHFTLDSDGTVRSRSQEMRNPAIELEFIRHGEPVDSVWVFANFPDLHAGTQQHRYGAHIRKLIPLQYTGLQVTRDPGKGVVWLGSLLLFGGLLVNILVTRPWRQVRMREDTV